jgi:hypothetical protein
VPIALAQGLHGSAFLVWLTVLTQPGVRRLHVGGQPLTIQVTGRRPYVPRWRLRLASLTIAQCMSTLRRAAAQGNDLQSAWHLEASWLGPPRGRRRDTVGLHLSRLDGG